MSDWKIIKLEFYDSDEQEEEVEAAVESNSDSELDYAAAAWDKDEVETDYEGASGGDDEAAASFGENDADETHEMTATADHNYSQDPMKIVIVDDNGEKTVCNLGHIQQDVSGMSIFDESGWKIYSSTPSPMPKSSTPAPSSSKSLPRSNGTRTADKPAVLDTGSVPGGRGGEVSGRGRSRGAWQTGDPLTQVYVTDDDLDDDLRDRLRHLEARRLQKIKRLNERRKAARGDQDGDESIGGDDEGDAALFADDPDALRFDWRPMDSIDIENKRETFHSHKTGPIFASQSALEAFKQYWDEEILQHIVLETNRYAATKRFGDWHDTNVHEILVLFAFWIMLGIIRMPSTKSCFSEHPLLKTSCFSTMFSRNRYERLCSCLHFQDSNLPCDDSSTHVLDPIISHLNECFKSAYVPRQEICIDESLTLWKGNLLFKQHIKTKAAKFGIKTFELCESATGYLWSFFVYTGKDSTPSCSNSSAPVLTLVSPLLNKGYTLFLDDRFNSPLLARFLKRNKTDVVGTLRPTRQNVPLVIKECDLKPGQYAARHSGDMTVLTFHDKKKMYFISTYHGAEIGLAPPAGSSRSRKVVLWRPLAAVDYSANMGGVDLKDTMLEAHLLERKRCSRWNMKFFKRLLNCSILNARICREATSCSRIDDTSFRLELVDQILSSHLSHVPKPRLHANQRWQEYAEKKFRFQRPSDDRYSDNRHWPNNVLKRNSNGRTMRRKCVHCGRLQTFECKICNVGLCASICFGSFHTRPS